jgi:hypothetical protein
MPDAVKLPAKACTLQFQKAAYAAPFSPTAAAQPAHMAAASVSL